MERCAIAATTLVAVLTLGWTTLTAAEGGNVKVYRPQGQTLQTLIIAAAKESMPSYSKESVYAAAEGSGEFTEAQLKEIVPGLRVAPPGGSKNGGFMSLMAGPEHMDRAEALARKFSADNGNMPLTVIEGPTGGKVFLFAEGLTYKYEAQGQSPWLDIRHKMEVVAFAVARRQPEELTLNRQPPQ